MFLVKEPGGGQGNRNDESDVRPGLLPTKSASIQGRQIQERQFDVERLHRGDGSSKRLCPLLGHKSFSPSVFGITGSGRKGVRSTQSAK